MWLMNVFCNALIACEPRQLDANGKEIEQIN